jgi:Na+(H+)/acetate symporter ActP
VGFAVTIVVSLVTRAPGAPIQRMVDQLRYPQLDAPAHVTEKTH